MRHPLTLLFILLIFGSVSAQPDSAGALGEYNEAYYILSELNTGLSALEEPINLQTPQAALEFFLRSSRDGNYARAAHALNLNLFSIQQQDESATELAEKLAYILDDKRLINWSEVSDRPDGEMPIVPGGSNPLAGNPRRTLSLGELMLDSRPISINLQRVRVGEAAPVWVFSASTVENIRALYDTFGPNALDRALPAWAKARPFWGVALWEWLALLLLIGASALLGWGVSALSSVVAERSGDDFASQLVDKLAAPLASTIALGIMFSLTSGGIPYTDAVLDFVSPLMWILFIVSLIWLGSSFINYLAEQYRKVEIQDLEGEDKAEERKRRTLISVGRRAFIFFAILLGLGVMLSRFANLEVIGTTLLTSAGIAGAVLGIAAQPSLGNIIAGIQIAITRPVRIGDTVIVDGSWAYIEDLRYTYAVVRTWDERRIILPLRELITEPVENWSHTDTHMVKPVYLYLDYKTDVEQVREKFIELVEASEYYDGEDEPQVLVTGVDNETIKLRGTVSGKDPDDAWALECEVREAMLAFLRDLDDGEHLPRQRVQVAESDNENEPRKRLGLEAATS